MKLQNHPGLIGPVDDARRERLLQLDELVRSNSTERIKLRWPSASEIQRAALNDLPADGPATKIIPMGSQLSSYSKIIRAGASVITHDRHESLVVPVVDRSLQASWSGTSNDLDNVPLQVTDATPRRVSCFVTISDQLRISNPVLTGQFVEMQLLSAVGLALDDAIVNGTGSGEPLGILADSDVLTHERASAGINSFADACGIERVISAAHGEDDAESFVWLVAPDTRSDARQAVGVTGVSSLWHDGKILDHQGIALPTAPNGTLILAQAPQIAVFDWGAMEIEALASAAQAKAGLKTLLVSAYLDCGVLDQNAVCVAVDPS